MEEGVAREEAEPTRLHIGFPSREVSEGIKSVFVIATVLVMKVVVSMAAWKPGSRLMRSGW